MILVDTSIWIDLLIDPRRIAQTGVDTEEFVICAPVAQEVLQGFADESLFATFRERLLSFPCLSDPLPLSAFVRAGEIYRDGRRKGFTIRSAADCLIAAIAIDNDVPVWHRDRDFTTIARYTRLRAVSKYLT